MFFFIISSKRVIGTLVQPLSISAKYPCFKILVKLQIILKILTSFMTLKQQGQYYELLVFVFLFGKGAEINLLFSYF